MIAIHQVFVGLLISLCVLHSITAQDTAANAQDNDDVSAFFSELETIQTQEQTVPDVAPKVEEQEDMSAFFSELETTQTQEQSVPVVAPKVEEQEDMSAFFSELENTEAVAPEQQQLLQSNNEQSQQPPPPSPPPSSPPPPPPPPPPPKANPKPKAQPNNNNNDNKNKTKYRWKKWHKRKDQVLEFVANVCVDEAFCSNFDLDDSEFQDVIKGSVFKGQFPKEIDIQIHSISTECSLCNAGSNLRGLSETEQRPRRKSRQFRISVGFSGKIGNIVDISTKILQSEKLVNYAVRGFDVSFDI